MTMEGKGKKEDEITRGDRWPNSVRSLNFPYLGCASVTVAAVMLGM